MTEAKATGPTRRMRDLLEIGGLLLVGLLAVGIVLAADPKPGGAISFLGTAFGSSFAVISAYLLARQKARSEAENAARAEAEAAREREEEQARLRRRFFDRLDDVRANLFGLRYDQELSRAEDVLPLLNRLTIVDEQRGLLQRALDEFTDSGAIIWVDVNGARDTLTKLASLLRFAIERPERLSVRDPELHKLLAKYPSRAVDDLDAVIADEGDAEWVAKRDIRALALHRELSRLREMHGYDPAGAEAGFEELVEQLRTFWEESIAELPDPAEAASAAD